MVASTLIESQINGVRHDQRLVVVYYTIDNPDLWPEYGGM
jgi:hypothetical protein